MSAPGFPEDFLWGTTASSVGAEGVGPTADWSAWEREHRAPRSADGNGWATNCADDALLLAALGCNAIRMTIEWARIEPREGVIDTGRVEHERQVLAALRAAGLAVYVTLQHGSLPGWFHDDRRGFRDEKARRSHWPRHVDRCAEWFEGLVAGWVPIEDPIGWATRGYLLGTRPPGHRNVEWAREAIVGALDANQQAWKLLRGGDAPVIASLGLTSVRHTGTIEARTEARSWDTVLWDVFCRARREGVLDVPGGPSLDRPDMAGAFDMIGVAYRPPVLAGDDATLGPYPATARTDLTGFAPNPEELGETLRRLAELAPNAPLLVSGDGVATADDAWREELLRGTVLEVRRAVADGVPVRGYFHDTGIDGYEWALGFDAPRGLVARDRTIKPSGRWFQQLLTDPTPA